MVARLFFFFACVGRSSPSCDFPSQVGILVGDIPYWTSANRAAMHRIQGVLDGTNTITKELTINWFDAFDREFCSKEVKECDTGK